MTYFIVSKAELRGLLYNEIAMERLEEIGFDNWPGYEEADPQATPEEVDEQMNYFDEYREYSSTLQNLMSKVRDWNILVGHVNGDPRSQRQEWVQSKKVREKALELIEEEVAELREAVEDQDDVEILDALADILFTLFGLAAKSGHNVVLEDGLVEVIKSNMTKVTGEKQSGKVKVGKPKGYKPPQIKPIIDNARESGHFEF